MRHAARDEGHKHTLFAHNVCKTCVRHECRSGAITMSMRGDKEPARKKPKTKSSDIASISFPLCYVLAHAIVTRILHGTLNFYDTNMVSEQPIENKRQLRVGVVSRFSYFSENLFFTLASFLVFSSQSSFSRWFLCLCSSSSMNKKLNHETIPQRWLYIY